MTVAARPIGHMAQTMKGRVAGSLKQAVEKTKSAFGRNGSGT
ncbi:hypothetical protein ACIA6D_14140 [Streptomyces cacaoi]